MNTNLLKSNKNEIRKTVLERVRNIADRTERSFLLKDDLLSFLRRYQRIALFFSLEDEIDTLPLIKTLIKEGKNIYLPKIRGNDLVFYNVKALSSVALTNNKYKLFEPTKGEVIPPSSIEVIICPGVAFDRSGNRLGRGKGYYDRYLEKCSSYKVGICYREQLLDFLPIENHDVKMDMIKAY